MQRDIDKLFNNENVAKQKFSKIRITLASPEKLNLGLMEKLKSLRQLIIELSGQKKMGCFVLEFLAQ